jgi:hypothetical protein
MRKARRIKVHYNDYEEDDDVDDNSVGLETSLGTVKVKDK